ncbi:MAG: AglZ/HisF2 family acetamidino modification protein [Vicingaceae bacterium]|nr:AglZ/HisF2 family acetamidino modification protein [Vicingaceae bacterium]
MRRVRVIPVLTLQNEKLVKTIQFKKPNYIGDPINAVKIFNDKEVDEIVILDISATKGKRSPNYERIEEIASKAFMPLAYGGGINHFDQIEKLFKLGIEKIIINSAIENNLNLIKQTAERYGSQSIIAAIDVKKPTLGKLSAYKNSGSSKIKTKLLSYLEKIEEAGAGEIFLTAIEKDGSFNNYDLDLINLISSNCNIPVVSCGGANSIQSFTQAINAGASAVAAGSLFVYSSSNKGVLINYPNQTDLQEQLFSKI